MKKIFICGSPRLTISNSLTFLEDLKDKENIYYLYKDSFDEIVNSIKKCDTIILSFPLYVDSPPSGTLKFFEYIKDNDIDISGKNLYTIINCGFLEAKQNNTAREIVKLFCFNNNINYMGCFKIGAGVIIGGNKQNYIYRLVSVPYCFKIRKFKKAINGNKKIEIATSIHPMTKFMYILLANINWKSKRKKYFYYKK